MKKRIIFLLLIVLMFCGCEKEMPKENPIVTMTFAGYGDVVMELYPNEAFNTVANFVNLVQEGFFKDNAITRIQKGFVIQAGGLKTLTYSIEGEFESNGHTNNIKHTKGVVSMARGQNKNSAGGQFFIMLGDASYLDGEYAAFGKVIDGMDVVEAIEKANIECLEPTYCFLNNADYIYISKATVDTKGYNYKVNKM